LFLIFGDSSARPNTKKKNSNVAVINKMPIQSRIRLFSTCHNTRCWG